MRRLVFSIVALVTAVIAVSAAAATQVPAPRSSPAHPVVAPGPGVRGPVHVDIFWPDGRRETVPAAGSGPPSAALAYSTMVARAAAESAPGGVRRLSDSFGASACSWSFVGPFRQNFYTVTVAASVSCTTDVFHVEGGLGLYRDAVNIGVDHEGGGSIDSPHNAAFWGVDGTCRPGGHSYVGYLTYAAQSVLGSGGAWQHTTSPIFITC